MPNTSRYILAVNERLVSHAQGVLILSADEIENITPEVVYDLGVDDEGTHYKLVIAVAGVDLTGLPEHDLSIGLRQSLAFVDSEWQYALFSTASQLTTWHYSFKFCPRCAEPLVVHPEERAKVCNSCGHHQYPRISPCIIVLVRKGNECLLAHAAKFPAGRYSTLAGFIEAGESAESAVHREVLEEAGVEIQNVEYRFSQSWPFPHSLMLGFSAEYKSGEIKPDGVEILDAAWFSADNLPVLPPRFTIARRLINQFLDDIGAEVEEDSRLFFAAE